MTYQRIRDLREDRDWTQQTMADMLHISRSTYSAYENGANAFPIDILVRLARLFETNIEYLVEQADDPTPHEPKRSE